jgi:hypothetical protein
MKGARTLLGPIFRQRIGKQRSCVDGLILIKGAKIRP